MDEARSQSADGRKAPGVVAVDGAECFLGRAIVKALLRVEVPVRALVLPGAKAAPPGAEVAELPLGKAEGPADKGKTPAESAGEGRAGDGKGDDKSNAKARVTRATLDEIASADPEYAEALRRATAEGPAGPVRTIVAARKLLHEIPSRGLTFGAVHAKRTAALLAAAEEAGVERMIHIGVATREESSRGRLAAAERLAEAHLAVSGLKTLVIRASLIVGPGDGHVSRMARKARSPWPVITFVGQGWARSAPMTLGDFAGCVAAAVLSDEGEMPPDALDVGGPEVLTAMDIQDRLLRHFARRKLKVHVMRSLASLGALAAELVVPGTRLTRARLSWLLDDHLPRRNAATKLLGRRPEPFEKAFEKVGTVTTA